MKTLMSIIGLLLVTTLSVNAQTKSMVKIQDLPKAISNNLSTQHKDWKASEAFKVDTKGVITYEVIAKNKMNEEMFWYDKNGKFIKTEPSRNGKMKMQKNAMNSSKKKTMEPHHSSASSATRQYPHK